MDQQELSVAVFVKDGNGPIKSTRHATPEAGESLFAQFVWDTKQVGTGATSKPVGLKLDLYNVVDAAGVFWLSKHFYFSLVFEVMPAEFICSELDEIRDGWFDFLCPNMDDGIEELIRMVEIISQDEQGQAM